MGKTLYSFKGVRNKKGGRQIGHNGLVFCFENQQPDADLSH